MFVKNTCIDYSLLLIMSIGKKSFTALGKIIKKSSDTVRRLLNPPAENFALMHVIATEIFKNKKMLVLSIDDTLLRKIYSNAMEGTCRFFDTKMGKMITAYKALIAGLTDGKYFIPIHCSFLFSKEVLSNAKELKDELVKNIIVQTIKSFPDKIITVAVDGAFATKKLFSWAIEKKIRLEARMHSNRKVIYKGEIKKISEIEELQPKGRHMARTIHVLWHDIPLYITAERRIDKHGEESIVYQASTYKAKPSEHVNNYKNRWPIEKFNRTGKQSFGLQDCFSTKLETQMSHLSSVLVAYAIVQIEMKKQKILIPEDAIRCLRGKNLACLKNRFYALEEIFGGVHA
jgi:hypothetical protein